MIKKYLTKILYIIGIILILSGNVVYSKTVKGTSKTMAPNPSTRIVTDNYYANRLQDIKDPMDIFMIFFGGEVLGFDSSVTSEIKTRNNIIITIYTFLLISYWIGLLLYFEKEKVQNTEYIDDNQIFEKYNPLLAGCIADSRNVLSRDVIAVVLDLINKKYLKLQLVRREEGNGTKYDYMISRIKANEIKMDPIQKYVNEWIFTDVHLEEEQVDLNERLKEISQSKETYGRMQELDQISTEMLNKMGANKDNVPTMFKAFDIILFIVSMLLCVVHIANNGLNVHIYAYTVLIIGFVIMAVILLVPLLAVGTHLILYIIAFSKKLINITNEKFTGQKIVATSVAVIIMLLVILIPIAIFSKSYVLVIDTIMIGICFLITKTDKLMRKDDDVILNDYYNIKRIKDKIEKYSLLDEKNIEFIKLWEEYLVYSVAFGNSEKISNKIKKVYKNDIDIDYLNKWDGVYVICKTYLEVIWECDFSK